MILPLVAFVAGAAGAGLPSPDDPAEQAYTAELAAIAPAAVADWEAANALGDRSPADTVRAYSRVIEAAPAFDGAWRRRCWTLGLLGDAAAEGDCRQALSRRASDVNRFALAYLLVSRGESLPEARQLLDAIQDHDLPGLVSMQLLLALRTGDERRARAWVQFAHDHDRLDESALVPFAEATLLSFDGHPREGRAALDRAEALGLDPALAAGLGREITVAIETDPATWFARALGVAGVWLAGALALVGAGAILSNRALAASNAMLHDRGAETLNAPLRLAYRGVLGLACLFYYASLPLFAGMAFTLGAAVFFIAIVARVVWPYPMVAAIGTVWAVFASALRPPRTESDAEALGLDENPALAALSEEVAARVGTPPVTRVLVVPGVTLAVTEDGPARVLVLGVGVLEGMTVGAFRSILAHEYGHFLHGDTGGGRFALRVRSSLRALALRLAVAGYAGRHNPVWLFVDGFHRVFTWISHGASRLQELHADRVSVRAYGADAFVAGLRHVVERDVAFDAHVAASVTEALRERRPLENIYSYAPSGGLGGPERQARVDEAMDRAASAYDSHPPPAVRMTWARVVGAAREAPEARAADPGARPTPEDGALAWTLVADRAALERRMTARIRRLVTEEHDVEFAAEPGRTAASSRASDLATPFASGDGRRDGAPVRGGSAAPDGASDAGTGRAGPGVPARGGDAAGG